MTELSAATIKGRTKQRGRGMEAQVNKDRLEQLFMREATLTLSLPSTTPPLNNNDDDGDADEWAHAGGDDIGQNEPADDFQPDASAPPSDLVSLLSAPPQVAPSTIQYAQTAKRVDVKALKESLWSAIQKEGVDGVSFQSVMDDVSRDYPRDKLASVSVSYCFICVLHLCNEHGLTLKSGEYDEGQASRSAPADVGYNLTHFTIESK